MLAATIKMMLTLQFGMTMSFTGIINAALSGNSTTGHNQNEMLRLTGDESSWLGIKNVNSIFFLFRELC